MNYHHLYYFWVVGKEGGMARAAQHLGMAVQTISAQVRALERDVGVSLLRPQGRQLVLTEAGVAVMHEADHIFALGEQLPQRAREAAHGAVVRLNLGISDGTAKMAVHRLLLPVLATPDLRLLCHEGEFDDLLTELVLHKLDAMLCDHAAPANPALNITSHRLPSEPIAWFAPVAWAAPAAADFPRSLADVPLLLPTHHSTVRGRIDQWLAREGLRPRLAGEFEDSALLTTFAASGMGVMPAAASWEHHLLTTHQLRMVGRTPQVQEQLHLISSQRKVMHPLVTLLIASLHPSAGAPPAVS